MRLTHSNRWRALGCSRAGLLAAMVAGTLASGCSKDAPPNPDRPLVLDLAARARTAPTEALPELDRHRRAGALSEAEVFYLEAEIAWTRGHKGRAARLYQHALTADAAAYRGHPVVRSRLLETLGDLECQARIDAATALGALEGEDVRRALEARKQRALDLPVCQEKAAVEAALARGAARAGL